ncbi:hypothetical protein FOZ60_005334 [Perkinsus olseni]|uniref:Uncharacterized protein n=1 Tax=Perkinsus olseni TaxID=32597 RepID=A0A7J6NRA3_PEROL|nr:hypothetical protein FOZ60_005334 [Perkinsus olseni]
MMYGRRNRMGAVKTQWKNMALSNHDTFKAHDLPQYGRFPVEAASAPHLPHAPVFQAVPQQGQSGILQGPYGLWIRRSDISTAAAAAKKLSPEHWSWFQTNGEKSRTSSLPVSTRTDVEHRRKRMKAVESMLKDLPDEQEYLDGQLDPVPQAILPPNPLEGAPAAAPTVEEVKRTTILHPLKSSLPGYRGRRFCLLLAGEWC